MAKETTNPNLNIYEKARSVPKEAIKEIKGGRLAGFSDINPMWRIKRLTEIFGPCGKGWYYEITDKHTETAGNETAMFITVSLYVKYGEEWSKPIVRWWLWKSRARTSPTKWRRWPLPMPSAWR